MVLLLCKQLKELFQSEHGQAHSPLHLAERG